MDEDGQVVDEQHSDVSLTADINMILCGKSFEVRLPRHNFHKKMVGGRGENPDLQTIRDFFRAHAIEHEENGGAVVTFLVNATKYNITLWVDAMSHGFSIVGIGKKVFAKAVGGKLRNCSYYTRSVSIATGASYRGEPLTRAPPAEKSKGGFFFDTSLGTVPKF